MENYRIFTMNMQTDTPAFPFSKRKEAIRKILATYKPDIIGSQELTDHMMSVSGNIFEGYDYVGKARHSLVANEHSYIFFNEKKYVLLKDETFWLSDTPMKEGSKFLLSQFPRIITMAILKSKDAGTVFTIFNTHLDHNFAIVRNKQASVLSEIIRTHAIGSFCILTGDFNTINGSKALETIKNNGLTDCVTDDLEASMRHQADVRRYHNKSIDHIFLSSNLKVIKTEKITMTDTNQVPSDHYPIMADLQYE